MDASETIAHFNDMGILDRVVYSEQTKKPLVILAKAGFRGYAERCMQDFKNLPGYSQYGWYIIGITTDDVAVVTTIV